MQRVAHLRIEKPAVRRPVRRRRSRRHEDQLIPVSQNPWLVRGRSSNLSLGNIPARPLQVNFVQQMQQKMGNAQAKKAVENLQGKTGEQQAQGPRLPSAQIMRRSDLLAPGLAEAYKGSLVTWLGVCISDWHDEVDTTISDFIDDHQHASQDLLSQLVPNLISGLLPTVSLFWEPKVLDVILNAITESLNATVTGASAAREAEEQNPLIQFREKMRDFFDKLDQELKKKAGEIVELVWPEIERRHVLFGVLDLTTDELHEEFASRVFSQEFLDEGAIDRAEVRDQTQDFLDQQWANVESKRLEGEIMGRRFVPGRWGGFQLSEPWERELEHEMAGE